MLSEAHIAKFPSVDLFQIECPVRNFDLSRFIQFALFDYPEKSTKHNSFMKLCTIFVPSNNRLWEESSKCQKKARGSVIFRFLENHFSKGMATMEVLTCIMGDRPCRGLTCSGSESAGCSWEWQRPTQSPDLGREVDAGSAAHPGAAHMASTGSQSHLHHKLSRLCCLLGTEKQRRGIAGCSSY